LLYDAIARHNTSKALNAKLLNVDPAQMKYIASRCVDRSLVLLPVEDTETAADKFQTTFDSAVDVPGLAIGGGSEK